MKYELKKPFTDVERADFICKHQGMLFSEDDKGIYMSDREETESEKQKRVNIESMQYLNSTDWYITRFLETGAVIPEDVTLKRAEARLKIIRYLESV